MSDNEDTSKINGTTTTLEDKPILDERTEADGNDHDPTIPAEIEEPYTFERGMASIPLQLDREQQVFELKLREPGVIRGCSIMLTEPKVLGASSMRNVPPIVSPVLHVECDPGLDVRTRRFMWVQSDAVIRFKGGARQAVWRATAVAAPYVRHLFEIIEVPS